MRVRIEHSETLTFAARTTLMTAVLRLTPRSSDSQMIRRWSLSTEPGARLQEAVDGFGNVTHTVSLSGPLQTCTLTATGLVETSDTNGVWSSRRQKLAPALFLRATERTEANAADLDGLNWAAITAVTDPLEKAHALMRALYAPEAEPTAAETGPVPGLARALPAERFTALARKAGLPARVASGFVAAADEAGAPAHGFWTEVYLAELGWVGFDVTRGLCVTERYVRIAAGLDALDATPIRSHARDASLETHQIHSRAEPNATAAAMRRSGQ